MPHVHEKIDFVTTIYIVYENTVLLVLHKKLRQWLAIGGHIELNEDPEEALFREVKEECGLEVELLNTKPTAVFPDSFPRFQLLTPPAYMDIHDVTPTHRHIGLEYFARAKNKDVVLAKNEHEAIRWFTKEELHDPQYNILANVQFLAEEALRVAAR